MMEFYKINEHNSQRQSKINHLLELELSKLDYFPCSNGINLRADIIRLKIEEIDRQDKRALDRRDHHHWLAQNNLVKLHPYFTR